MFEFDAKSTAKEEDAFHFVSYVPVNGRLYELDGLREGPIDLGVCNQDDWINAVRPVIEKRIQKYSEGEIRFNLMAIVSDRKMIYEQKIADLQRQLAEEEPMDTDQSSNILSSVQSEVAKYQMLIEEENQKLKRYKIENIRRKHNYLPFIMELLKTQKKNRMLRKLKRPNENQCLYRVEAWRRKCASECLCNFARLVQFKFVQHTFANLSQFVLSHLHGGLPFFPVAIMCMSYHSVMVLESLSNSSI
ncbi:putative Ubiquitin carboxyl-terminal hydrolase protein [Naja naja]|nr:putative Ubiquitin carboxyl-terminal hydrolase protein [Naja naja]